MSETKQRLTRALTTLFGGKPPFRQWTLTDISNQLIEHNKQQQPSSFIKFEGYVIDQYAGDSLVKAGFRIVINPNPNNPSFTLTW